MSTIDDAVKSLEKELEEARKARLITLIVGAILFLVIFFVLMAFANRVRKEFRPDSLADLAAFATRQAVKEGRPAVEKAFKENIPVFLKNLRIGLVNEVVPLLRKEIERELQKLVNDAFLNSSKAFTDAVRSAVEKVKPVAAKQGTPPPDTLAALITREFEVETEKRLTDRPTETLGAQYEQSQAMLKGLNERLMLLAGKKRPQTRSEALELKFIRAWVSLLTHGAGIEEGKPSITSPEGTGANTPVPPPMP